MRSSSVSLLLLGYAVASPAESIFSIPLLRKRNGLPLSERSSMANIEALTQSVRKTHYKFGLTPPDFDPATLAKRALGAVQLADVTGDIQYYGSIQIGTPPVNYEVIMDTGSADLIMAANPCSGCVATTPIYSASQSSSGKSSNVAFSIQYGTGAASGTLAQDSVSIAGYNVAKQTFAACNNLSNIVDGDQSGLLGLAWQTIATSGAVPLLQDLANSGKIAAPEFSFAFARWSTTPSAYNSIEPGGIMTVGGTNATLFSGNVNYIPLADQGSYWLIPLSNVKVSGASLGISYAQTTIDTGTSLIGMPIAAVQAIYAKIPGSQAYQNQGLYEYPCTSNIAISFTFGGIDYPMLPSDFNNGATTSSGKMCVGAVFALASQGGVEQIIFGDAFLKNVYSTYRFSPPAVGFATLANPNNVLMSGSVPTSNGTTQSGTSATANSNSGSGSSSSSGGAASASGASRTGVALGAVVMAMMGALAM